MTYHFYYYLYCREADDTKPVRARAVRKKIIKEDVVTIAPSAHSPDATVIATSIGR